MKFVLLTILSTIIIFFVWNILKRMFFSTFYQFPKDSAVKNNPKNINQNVKWDAETVDYEEVKTPKNENAES